MKYLALVLCVFSLISAERSPLVLDATNRPTPLVAADQLRLPSTGPFYTILTPTATATRTVTFPDATGTLPLLSLAQTWTAAQSFTTGTTTISTVDINGGAIDGTAIGVADKSTGAFTTLSATGVLSTSDTTEASSTTVAALKSAGGLAVVKRGIFGDYVICTGFSTDSAVAPSSAAPVQAIGADATLVQSIFRNNTAGGAAGFRMRGLHGASTYFADIQAEPVGGTEARVQIIVRDAGAVAQTVATFGSALVTIPSGKALTVASDTDATTILGRAKIGAVFSDGATFAHFDHLTTTNYGLHQSSAGSTIVNAVSGGSVTLRNSGTTVVTVSSSAVTVAQALNVNATTTITDATFNVTGTAGGILLSRSGGGNPYIQMTKTSVGSVIFRVTAADTLAINNAAESITMLGITPTAITLPDASNIVVNTTTGTKIATATTQKLGFWNATPIVQPSSTGETTGWTTGGGSAATSTDTYTGNSGTKAYTMNDVVKHLKAAGILATN